MTVDAPSVCGVRSRSARAGPDTGGHNSGVSLGQISWAATVAICVIAAVLVLINGYVGYFGVRVLGAVTPLGGVALLIGWGCVCFCLPRRQGPKAI